MYPTSTANKNQKETKKTRAEIKFQSLNEFYAPSGWWTNIELRNEETKETFTFFIKWIITISTQLRLVQLFY